jgi:hypothetical protein
MKASQAMTGVEVLDRASLRVRNWKVARTIVGWAVLLVPAGSYLLVWLTTGYKISWYNVALAWVMLYTTYVLVDLGLQRAIKKHPLYYLVALRREFGVTDQ